MAKPKARVQSAAIAGMLGVSSATSAPGGGPAGAHTAVADIGTGAEGAHPVRDRTESGIARADNALVLDPKRVARRGRYVRPFTDDERFRDLLVAIEEAGRTIHVPILVRVEGPPGAVEYVLVDGTHRLEAALRLGIPVPAVNLGRIPSDRALAIQAMANEVRASMHMVDQVSYVLALLAQGLTRESVQRTTGFSAGRVSELVSIGMLIAGLSEADRERARRAARVTHRALRALKTTSADADAFRRGVMALVVASEADAASGVELDSFGDELGDAPPRPGGPATTPAVTPTASQLGANGYQIPVSVERSGIRRGRTTLGPGGVTFVPGRNARGTSVTFRIAWRSRAARAEPEVFLEQVRDLLEVIAAEATTYYEDALARGPAKGRRRRGGGVAAATEAWRSAIARDEAELGSPRADVQPAGSRADALPEEQNPMPVPPSQRRPGDAGPAISPRLLAGLSIPMLAERLKRRPADYQQLESHVSDVERQADDARRRVRELVDAEESDRQGDPGARRRPSAPPNQS